MSYCISVFILAFNCLRVRSAAALATRALMLLLLSASSYADTAAFASAGTFSWTAPVGVSAVTVEAWGGGGAGGGATANPAKGGGGAGGQYARKAIAVTSGNSYPIVVGAGGNGTTSNGASGGDSSFSSPLVVAKGGAGGTRAANGIAGTGSTAGGVGDVVYRGGHGTDGSRWTGEGGAGGGGAGSSGNGDSAVGLNGGSGTSVGGGAGADGLTGRSAGNSGSVAGGGGGGGYATNGANQSGGDGGDGRIVLTYVVSPTVVSITRASTNPTLSNTAVSWTVIFSLSVTGVDVSDFVLAQSGGASGASITSVSGSGTSWTVVANSGSSSTGTIGLNLVDDDSITGGSPVSPLVGVGSANGNFSGEVYTLTPPVATLSKTASASSAVVGDVITFSIKATNPHGVPLSAISIADVLPTGMTYSTHVSSLGTVSVAGPNVTWTIPSLAAGTTAQLTLAVALTAQGAMTNTVTSPGAASASASILVLANAITHFRMDEPVDSWTGATGEVVDSGGTNLHGRRRATSTPTDTNAASPAPTIQSQYSSVVGGFCNAGLFDGKAVVESADSPLFDYTNKLSASAWIYPTAYPTGDLYSILSNDVNYEFHLNTNGKLYWWWNAATLTSAATIPLNQWTHIAITFSSVAGAGRQRIYINGVADPNSSNWTGTLQQNNCPFYIGGDITTGAACSLIPGRNFRGMIDEVKLYNVELGAAEVQADMNLGRSCSGTFDHIQIEHDGVASICAPETVTLKACLDASCSTLYTGTVNVRLSPTGWVGGDTFSFSGGITSKQLSYGTAGDVALGTVSVSPTPANSARCFKGSSETCTMNFAASSCSFDAVEVGAAPQTRLFTKLAGVPFNVDVLALSGPTAVNTSYVGTAAVDLVDASVSACPTGPGLNTATNITYSAANNGRKPVSFTYANAARNVRVRTRVGSSAPACSTDSFTVRPQAFSAISSSANADNAGLAVAATPAVKAGAVFTLTADTGVAGYDGNPRADPALIEWLTPPSGGRPAPGVGVLDGSTPGNLLFSTAASAASGNGASGGFTYNETGYFRFKAQGVLDDTFTVDSSDKANGDCVVGSFSNTLSAAGKYGCNLGNLSASNHFGRFIPDHFDTSLTQACVAGNFTYSGQPFPLQITAKNVVGGTTQNYSGGFARAVSLLPRDATDTTSNPGPGAIAPAVVAAADFSAGVATPAPTYTFDKVQTAPTNVQIRASESEVTSLRTPAPLTVEGIAAIVGGRVRLANAYGSELLDLPVVFRTETWDGSGWVIHTADSCTGDSSLGAANAVSLGLTSVPAALPTCVLDSGKPGSSGAGCVAVAPVARQFREGATPGIGFAGDFNLWLAAPGANNFGSTTITAAVPAWLGNVPPAIATFGRYKTPLIYRRENY